MQPPPPGTTPPPIQQQQQFMLPAIQPQQQPVPSLLGQPPSVLNHQHQQQLNVHQEGVYVPGTGFVTRTVQQTTMNVVTGSNLPATTTLPQTAQYLPKPLASTTRSSLPTPLNHPRPGNFRR